MQQAGYCNEWMEKDSTKEMLRPIRELQRTLCEMLQVFDQVCRDNGLKYYLAYGTLLGAIRHHGFIPWDDDADVFMPRQDYEKLLKIKKWPEKYFLQSYKTEPYYRHTFAKLRLDGTTCMIFEHRHIKMHHGVFIDIFPLDKVPTGKIRQLLLWNVPYVFERMAAFSVASLPQKMKWLLPIQKQWQRLFKPSLFLLIANFFANWLASSSSSAKFFLDTFSPMRISMRKCMFPIEQFGEGRFVEYESLMLQVPIGSENLLKQEFGDYMKWPPEETRRPSHSSNGGVLDVTHDYKCYQNGTHR